jgi:aspartate/methionine/tyrosine aminotransferase
MAMIRSAISGMENQRISEVTRLGIEEPDVIPLWFGESDVVTPDFIQRAAVEAMAAGRTFYVHRRGIRPLRHAFRDYLGRVHGVDLDLDRLTITGSGMTAIMIALECLVDNGDNVVMVSPIWPNIFYAVRSLGGECRHVRLDPTDDGWRLDIDALFAACDSRTRAVFIASPGNPTGWIIEPAEQRRVLDFAVERGIWVVADEVYHRLVFDRDGPAPSFLEVSQPEDPLFVIQSFSKSWAMTGWRLGCLIHPVAISDRVGDLSAVNNTGATSFVQHAGVTAVRDGEPFVAQLLEYCRKGRELVHERLRAMDRVRAVPPQGAFYAFFSVDRLTDDLGFAQNLVRTAKVGVAPGSAFGPGNEGYLRLCFAHCEDRLMMALDRLATVLA